MLNWIVWNRTAYLYKNGFSIKNVQMLIYHKNQINNEPYQSDAYLKQKPSEA